MQSSTTKQTKTTKKLRKALIMEAILNGTFNRQQLTQKFHCSDRAFRNDMNELATALEQPIENQVTMLRAICAERLSTLAAKKRLDPTIMAKILVAGFSRKVELKEEITETKNVNINVSSMLAEYEQLLTEKPIETQPVPNNNPAEQVHPAQANSEASRIPVT